MTWNRLYQFGAIPSPKPRRLAVAFAAILASSGLSAQGVKTPETLDKIIGSEVAQGQVDAADMGRVIRAIEATADNISIVRKTTTLDKVEIVFLSHTEARLPGEIAAKLRELNKEVAQLRQELEGNAMLYHAINSRQILLRDIVAIEFDRRQVVIYAAKPAN
jgi:hypothetical protein